MKKKFIGFAVSILMLLFCCEVFAATPTLGTVVPSNGTGTPDKAQSFVCSYSDADGWAHLKEAYFMIRPVTFSYVNSGYLYYNQNTNLLYLRNDNNTAWLGGYAPGSANSIENSQIKLNCSSTSISGSGTTLTVTFNISFKQNYYATGARLYLSAKDDSGNATAWASKGSFTINYSPGISSFSPTSGTGQAGVSQIFTTTVSDGDGWSNINYVYFLISISSSAATNCFYGYYNQNTNLLYLRNDNNTAWLGGYAPGSANSIENSYAKLDCSLSTVTGVTSALTINWAVMLKKPFTGSKNTYVLVRDDLGASVSFTKMGSWVIPNSTPQCISVTPATGSSSPDQALNIMSSYSDPDTLLNLQNVYLLINNSTALTNCSYVYFDQKANKLYLRNNANSGWLGGYAPGTSNVIENSYVKLDCSLTTISSVDNILMIKWALSFKSVFTGDKKIYLSATDVVGANSGFVQKGVWSILALDTIPPVISITEPLDGAVIYD